MPNLRNAEDYLSTIWDWTPFNECFVPTKIRITDIDGFVERHGQFLLIETKRPNAIIPTGQAIMFDEMIKTGLFTILIIWGKTNLPEKIKKMSSEEEHIYDSCNIEMLKRIIRQWFDDVNKRSKCLEKFGILLDQKTLSLPPVHLAEVISKRMGTVISPKEIIGSIY